MPAAPVADMLICVIAEHFNRHPTYINPETALVNDLGADSLDLIEIPMIVEVALGIDTFDWDIAATATVGDLIKLAQEKSDGR